jgi:hypothetical protein
VRAVAPESAAVLVHLAPGLREAGNTDAAWDARGTIAAATVALRDRAVARDARVVQHELLHALGLGHVAAWPSVLAAPGARTAGAATPDDVAHGQLIAAVRALARPGRAGRAALPGPPLLAPP